MRRARFTLHRREVLALPALLVLPALVPSAGCRPREVSFEYTGERAFSRAERSVLERCAEAAVREVRARLPMLPVPLLITVSAGKDVIPETGETATAYPPSTVAWVVDASGENAVVATVSAQLRFTLFHELHHLVRDAALPRVTLLDHVVAEGLATAFERDAAGAKPPWGVYPPEAARWVKELTDLPKGENLGLWLYGKHADGRRWVGLRAGTYVADRAMRALGKSSEQLVTEPTRRILDAAREG